MATMRTESSRWIPEPGSVNRPEVFVRSMRASAKSVRFVMQEKTAQTESRILNGFQRARSQTRWKNTANRIKDGRIQKSLAIPKSAQTRPPRSPEDRERDTGEKNIQRFYAEPVLNRKKAENRTGHH